MTPPPFRLVATDLDGTLLRDDGTVSHYTVGVLARFLVADNENYVLRCSIAGRDGTSPLLAGGYPPPWVWRRDEVGPHSLF